MSENKKPRWLNAHKLVEAAGEDIQKKTELENSIKLNSTRITQIAAYSCPGCRLKFTSGQIEPQIRKAARESKSYVECPQCSTALKEDRVVQIKGAPDIVHRAEYLRDTNRHPNSARVPNMWVDKAIYGRLVQKLSEFVAKIGITNPQMRFQRGIRSSKFPGEPHSAKGAEFSVEFVDQNNTRNRIFIQAGLTSKGEFIFPKIFKNTIGQEYPLTKEAIANLTSGKLFDPVMLNSAIPPLRYRDRDYTRFREISADQKKIQKIAQDPAMPAMPTGNDPVDENALDMQVQEIGITDPADQQAVKEIMKKYIDPNNPQAFAPGMSVAQTGENFMQGVGLGSMKNKLNFRKAKIRRILADARLTPAGEQRLQESPELPNSALDMVLSLVARDPSIDRESIWLEGSDFIIDAWHEALKQGLIISESIEEDGEFDLPSNPPPGMASKLNLRKISKVVTAIQENYTDVVLDALDRGLAYDEAVTEVYDKTGMPLNDSVWAAAANYLEERASNEPIAIEAALAKQLVASAEEKIAKKYQKTAAEVKDEFDFSGLTSSEVETFVDTFVTEYNNALTSGQGPTKAQHQAHYAASRQLHANRVKTALRDETTLVPFTETDPEYSLAEQTVQAEPRFDKPDGDPLKYDEMDGGISNPEDRNITHMFGRDKQAKKAYITHENDKYIVHAESGKQLGKHDTKGDAEKQLQAIEINKHKKGAIKTAAYELTDLGLNALNQLVQGGYNIPGYDPQALKSILGYFSSTPGATTDALQQLAQSVGFDPEIVRATFTKALAQGLLTIEPETPPEIGAPLSSEGSISKEGESTGVDLDSDEVGPNPINYSRYKEMVQDLIRANNIPPTKVDMHALKDNKYSLQELKDLVQTFKVNDDAAMYPTQHASREDLIKLAETKLSEMIKEMPMERIPNEKDTSAEGETVGGNEPPLTKDEVSEMHEDMSENTPEKDTIPGGKGDNVPSAAFDAEQLVRGIEVEKEHTDDPEKAKEIAKDHLMEDPAYYTKLNQMESTTPPRNVDELHAALTEQAFNVRKKTYGIASEEGMQIAQALHVDFGGILDRGQYGSPMYTFTDPITKSTFMADTLETAQEKLSVLRSRFGVTASKTAQEEPLPPGTILGPQGEIVSQPKGSPLRIEPPQFLTRKEPKIEEEEAVAATPEETALIQELNAGKQQIDTIQNQIAGMQKELQIKIGPLQQELGVKGQAQMKATRALITLMRQLGHTLIQADDKIGHYIEAPLTHKLTASDKLKVLLEQFGDRATQVLAEAEQNLNRIEQAVVIKYKQWPKKTSADIEAEDQFIATLYQNTYNALADLLDAANELNQVLA
jgi:hypothetical protein